MIGFWLAFVFSVTVSAGAGWLLCESLSRLMRYHTRRLSVGILYMQQWNGE